MVLHKLKTVQPFFRDIWEGVKTFDVRFNDRNFQVGDRILLVEYGLNGYGDNAILCEVIYLFKGILMLKEGYVVLGISIIDKVECWYGE